MSGRRASGISLASLCGPGEPLAVLVSGDRLKLAAQDAFDKAAGINHYANPNIGESYTMATEANIPGFKQ